MKKKTKFKVFLVLLYFIIVGLCVLFVPTLVGLFLMPIMDATFIPEGLYILDWTIIDGQGIAACICLWFSLTVAYIFAFANSNWKNNRGDEYGSARLLSDDEFDSILPNYIYYKDEYDNPGPKNENPPERIDEADKVVFDYFEYEEVKNYE